jgi:hypothetical protein
LGGSFDLSGISGTYTESYVKTAISDFVAGCKTDSIWTKITEAYLLSGVTFSGVLAKLKHGGTAALTNVNFVSGDYLAAGSGAGLIGNGSTKYLQTGASSRVSDVSLSAYVTNLQQPTFYAGLIGAKGGPTTDGFYIAEKVSTLGGHCMSFRDVQITGFNVACYIISSAEASICTPYKNGTATTATLTLAGTASGTYGILASNSSGSDKGNSRISFAHCGTGLTTTNAANLSTRVNALMTALGANVY